MKKLKIRFKKALFAFFKEDILETVNYTGVKTEHFVCSEMNLIELKSQIILDEREFHRSGKSINLLYNEALNKAKKQLFNESMKYIVIDEKSIVSSEYVQPKVIQFSLFVGSKN